MADIVRKINNWTVTISGMKVTVRSPSGALASFDINKPIPSFLLYDKSVDMISNGNGRTWGTIKLRMELHPSVVTMIRRLKKAAVMA